MKILTGPQIKEADKFTIENEPISSIQLMERASAAIAEILKLKISNYHSILVLAGKGNNGGDGLAIARLLSETMDCSVFMPFATDKLSEECHSNFTQLPPNVVVTNSLETTKLTSETLIIDALLGTGMKGNLDETLSTLIASVNELPNYVISIDVPSGMCTEFGNINQIIIRANETITLQFPKLAMLLPEAGEYCGKITICPIGINVEENDSFETPYSFITTNFIKKRLKKRTKFANKGTYGHALLICGSKGMNGAALLATNAALRSGCGLVTLHLPEEERFAVQANCPSAILSLDQDAFFSEIPTDLPKYSVLAIGPGLGQNSVTIDAFRVLLESFDKPMVIDADAINILSKYPELKRYIPKNSILTPHPRELQRLIGDWSDEEHKLKKVIHLAVETDSVIVLKGAYTTICTVNGHFYFNPTGNSGMAKGGSGDILTGFIAGLLARGYDSLDAAIIGVYIHGSAGDKVASIYGQEAMNSKDIIDYIPVVMKELYE